MVLLDIEPPELDWRPLAPGFLEITIAHDPLAFHLLTQNASAIFDPIAVAFDASLQSFFFDVREVGEDTARWTSAGLLHFDDALVNQDIGGAPFDAHANDLLRKARTYILRRMERGLQSAVALGEMRAFARVNSPIAKSFTHVPSDALRHFAVEDWHRGCAASVGGDRLYSIQLTAAAATGRPSPFDAKTKTADFAKWLRDKCDGKLPAGGWKHVRDLFLADHSGIYSGIDDATMRNGLALLRKEVGLTAPYRAEN